MTAPMPGARILFRRLPHGRGLPAPSRASAGSAGFDLCAAIDGSLELAPSQRRLVPSGIALQLPRGWEAQVRPRSGLALRHGITLLNSPGTIDSDYRGEVGVVMVNLGEVAYTVHRGDRIAQVVFARVAAAELVEVAEVGETERGAGGFGSTGR